MSEQEKTTFQLVPEIALLAPLPEHLRKRFEHALTLMHEELAEHKTWQQIASESAISPYHFHRQFTELFNETPGQYLSRLRLQMAVRLLINDEPWSVMDIAHYCGYSSSQALGKALKRELGVTAKKVREMGYESTPLETAELVAKLAHPGVKKSKEYEMAETMPTEVKWFPERGMKEIPIEDPDWDTVFAIYNQRSLRLMVATAVHQKDIKWRELKSYVGDWQAEEKHHDIYIPAGHYLCTEVYVVSDVAYIAAIETLFEIAVQQNLEIDESGYLVEMVSEIEMTFRGGLVLILQLPILSRESDIAP